MSEELMQALPAADREFLARFGDGVRLEQDGSGIHVIFQYADLGDAYVPNQAELMIVLPPGYPNLGPDMYWTHPHVRLKSGAEPDRASVYQEMGSKQWQRWSRHPSCQWRSGTDSLQNYYAAVRRDLAKGI